MQSDRAAARFCRNTRRYATSASSAVVPLDAFIEGWLPCMFSTADRKNVNDLFENLNICAITNVVFTLQNK
jgi:hypothetical protein